MNILWRNPSLTMIPRSGDGRALKSLILTLTAAHGGGVPLIGMGFCVGGDLVHWKPTGEVVTIGGMEK